MVQAKALSCEETYFPEEVLSLSGEKFQAWFDDVIFAMDDGGELVLQDPLAKTYKEAVKSRDWPIYRAAMEVERKNLENRKPDLYGPWVDRTPDMVVVGGTWAAFTLKGSTMKARYPLRGDQIPMEKRGTTFSPGGRPQSRAVICVIVVNTPGAKMFTTDVPGAYLQGKAHEKAPPIYTTQHPDIPTSRHPNILRTKVRRVIGNQYGKPDAGYIWREHYHPAYVNKDPEKGMGFKVNRADSCLSPIAGGRLVDHQRSGG